MKREPILFIRGSKERAEEIRHVLIDEWGGYNYWDLSFHDEKVLYFIDQLGRINVEGNTEVLRQAIEKGWMKEYIIPEQPKFKPFDKVVVKPWNIEWIAHVYSHEDDIYIYLLGNIYSKEHTIILPYNEKTAKLIGTNDEWEGGEK